MIPENNNQDVKSMSKQIEVLRLELRECSDLLIHFKIWNENIKESLNKNDNTIKEITSSIDELKRKNASYEGGISSLNKFSGISFTIALSLCSWVGYTIINLKQDVAKMQENVITNKANIDANKADIDTLEGYFFKIEGVKK